MHPIQPFLDDLAAATATPGGGGAAAATGAMGAALVSMVCNLTIGRKKFADIEADMQKNLARSEELRARLTGMIREDAEAFDTVMAAYRMAKATDEEKTARKEAIQTGYRTATLVPLAVAKACAELIRLAETVAKTGNPNAISDAGAAALCAQAGLKAASLNVLINLSAIADREFVAKQQAELDEILDQYEHLAEEVYTFVKSNC